MERVRWWLAVSPVFVLGLVLVTMVLGRKKLFKRRKPKDEESADILEDMEDTKSTTKNVPPNQHEREVKRHTGNISGPDGTKIPLSRRKQESERRSSPGTGDHPRSAPTSHTTSNRKSSVQSSIRSGQNEWEKWVPSEPATQETDRNVFGASGQQNQTESDRNSERSSRSSQPSSRNSRQHAHSDQPLENKSRTNVVERDFIRFSTDLENTRTSSEAKRSSHGNVSAASGPRNQTQNDRNSEQSPKRSRSSSRNTGQHAHSDQPPKKMFKTDIDEQDSVRLSNELENTKRSSEAKRRSYDKRWENQKGTTLEKEFDDSQQFNTTSFPREDSGKGPQRDDFDDIRSQSKRFAVEDNDDSTQQSEPNCRRSSPRDEHTDTISYIDPIKEMFLQKILALDVTARNISNGDGDMSSDTDFDFNTEEPDDPKDSDAVHPLDVSCDVLNDSDTLFQQEIVTKMSMCQFALPLLLPAGDGSRFTFMLWAMRDIVKRWKPHSLVDSTRFVEANLVNIPMPIFSFVRLGKCSLSKSKLLNQVLSPPEFIHNYFVHGDMPGGNLHRKCSDGLVEMSCYFPGGRGQSDIFPEPITAVNLRGDLECHPKQFDLLSRVSSAVFVFIENINERQYGRLSELVSQNSQLFLVVNLENSDVDILPLLKNLSTTHNLKNERFIVKNRKINDTLVVKTLQSKIKALIANTTEKPTLEQISRTAAGLDFEIDENFKECNKARAAAMQITEQIKNVLDYKKETMKLQGDLWKQLAKSEKELCRMRNLEDKDVEEYKCQLQEEIVKLRNLQSQQKLANGVRQFVDALVKCSLTERKVFLKWLKIQLDARGRHQLATLNDEYRKLLRSETLNTHALMEIDQKLADGSLGVEHFIRELAQFYEAKHFLGEPKMSRSLPKTAADLLLAGFPLEIIDGDASNIPLQWIKDVLHELDIKTGRNRTIRVITVLGVQSTGKSTLLNTMFGLHLPTSSGRCTRGAFMTLLDARKNFQEDLGCDYVMVIDTEGLKSMELASLEGSYEHDNELATVVVGMSDITIVNMAMENTEEMKDILQIVIQAFLRMTQVGKMSSCQFVHQNVSDVAAHVNNRRAREKFIEQLNEMTKVSARMEKKGGVTAFSDIIHCDIENNSWYIPGLWQGTPPMASINYGYSEKIKELKKSLARYLKSMPGKPQDILQFTEWMKSLWDAVKHEKFVFSFRNRLVSEAYNQLCIQFSDWEWTFQKNSHDWMIDTETLILNLSSHQLGSEFRDQIQNKVNHLLDKEETIMGRSLEKYFRDDCDNAHLLEMFQGDFLRSIKFLRKNLENVLLGKCDHTIKIQKEKCQIQAAQEMYINMIEERVSDLMDKIRKDQYSVNEEQLSREFEMVWGRATSTLAPRKLKKRNIDLEILQQLKRDMQCGDSKVMQKLDSLTSLNHYKGKRFSVNDEYPQVDSERERLALSIWEKCCEKVREIANFKKDFDSIYSLELLKMINNDLNREDAESLRTTKLFELDLKLCVLGNASVMFQRMHEEFVRSHDPQSYLEEMKPQYFSMFNNMFEKRNECQRRAEQFYMVCLRPAVMDHINRRLGQDIVDDILQKNGPQEFKNRKLLHREVLKTLLIDGSSTQYAEFVNSYEQFMKRWISQYLSKHYEGHHSVHTLQVNILQSLMVKIKKALYDENVLQAKTISGFLAEFGNVLKKELVISQNNTKVVIFQSNLSTIKQFAHDVELYLPNLEKLVKRHINSLNIEATFSQLSLKPQDELFRKVVGCGKQCPFCKAPCEAGGGDHKEHFASVHRPRGLAQHINEETKVLDHSICSSNVISNKSFRNADTERKPHPYKDYRKYYPDWAIYPDTTPDGSDYWRFVLREFNASFAELYNARPANLPEHWNGLTKQQALQSLKNIL